MFLKFRVGFPTTVNWIQKLPYRWAQKFIFQIILDPVDNINYHTRTMEVGRDIVPAPFSWRTASIQMLNESKRMVVTRSHGFAFCLRCHWPAGLGFWLRLTALSCSALSLTSSPARFSSTLSEPEVSCSQWTASPVLSEHGLHPFPSESLHFEGTQDGTIFTPS